MIFMNLLELARNGRISIGWLVAVCVCSGVAVADESDNDRDQIPPRLSARDTLTLEADPKPDAEACLNGLRWKPQSFEVRCREAPGELADMLATFPSPRPSGDRVNDKVTLECFLVREGDGKLREAPAVVVVHESGSRMEVGRLCARGFRQLGIHAFMVQLPYYGHRRSKEAAVNEGQRYLSMLRQGIADVRRARDAVAAFPCVKPQRISLQGTSLGGFVSADAAALDPSAFDRVFLLLAGGDLFGVIQHGDKDAAAVRRRLAAAGWTDRRLQTALDAVEPLRIAHRLDPARTWLFSGRYDKVVPLKHAQLLADAVGLPKEHHVMMLADHYSGIVFLPMLLKQMSDEMKHVQPQPRSPF